MMYRGRFYYAVYGFTPEPEEKTMLQMERGQVLRILQVSGVVHIRVHGPGGTPGAVHRFTPEPEEKTMLQMERGKVIRILQVSSVVLSSRYIRCLRSWRELWCTDLTREPEENCFFSCQCYSRSVTIFFWQFFFPIIYLTNEPDGLLSLVFRIRIRGS